MTVHFLQELPVSCLVAALDAHAAHPPCPGAHPELSPVGAPVAGALRDSRQPTFALPAIHHPLCPQLPLPSMSVPLMALRAPGRSMGPVDCPWGLRKLWWQLLFLPRQILMKWWEHDQHWGSRLVLGTQLRTHSQGVARMFVICVAD